MLQKQSILYSFNLACYRMCKSFDKKGKIMNIKSLLYIFVSLLIITGCSTSKKEIEKIKVIDEFDNAPTWIQSPKLNNYISEIGKSSASNEIFNTQRDKAIENAKANLLLTLNTKLTNIFSLIGKKYIEDEVFAQKIEDANNELISNAINESRIMKLWKSNKQNIYVMVSSDTNKLKKDLKSIVDSSFNNYSTVASEYRLHLEQGNIDLELNN